MWNYLRKVRALLILGNGINVLNMDCLKCTFCTNLQLGNFKKIYLQDFCELEC